MEHAIRAASQSMGHPAVIIGDRRPSYGINGEDELPIEETMSVEVDVP